MDPKLLANYKPRKQAERVFGKGGPIPKTAGNGRFVWPAIFVGAFIVSFAGSFLYLMQ